MTPKQKYDERRKLRADRLLRQEQKAKEGRDSDDDAKDQLQRLMNSFERIADFLELWADNQTDCQNSE